VGLTANVLAGVYICPGPGVLEGLGRVKVWVAVGVGVGGKGVLIVVLVDVGGMGVLVGTGVAFSSHALKNTASMTRLSMRLKGVFTISS